MLLGDLVLVADADVFAVGDKVAIHGFELFFDLKPREGQQVVNIVELADFGGDGAAEICNAVAALAGGFDNGADVGVFGAAGLCG
jgi:hypothetical protein